MADYFRKTERGRREVRERSLQLSRAARNLLLIIDGSRTIGTWVGMCQRATLADGVALLEGGLIEALPGPVAAEVGQAEFPTTQPLPGPGPGQRFEPAPTPATTPAPFTLPSPLTRPGALQPLAAQSARISRFLPLEPHATHTAHASGRLTELSYGELLTSLNALIRETLGLFRGYRYTLRVEHARNVEELEAVARDFVLEVQRLRGDSMARMVHRALGMGDLS